jgi:23S rRNA (uracil1939-C5)-methyltransferase
MPELRVEALGAQGDGVAHRADGAPLYAAGAVPGDVLRLDDSGAVVGITPGPNRAEPPCPHFGSCGGCSLQHVAMPVYQEWLGSRIRMALLQHDLDCADIAAAHISPIQARRRAKLRAVKRGGTVEIGFNEERAHKLVNLSACTVMHPSLFAVLEPLRTFLKGQLKENRAAGVQLTLSDTGVDCVLSDVPPPLSMAAQQAFAAFAHAAGLARLSVEGPAGLEMLAEPRQPVMRIGGVPVQLPPGGFIQATSDGEAALQAAVLDAVGGAKKVVDLFCGLGTFALPLSDGRQLWAVDGARAPVLALDAASRTAMRRIKTDHRDLYRRPLMAAELKGWDAVVFDPPRAGAKEQCAQLAKSPVPKIVAVSCNPNTFARDARLLADGGYTLQRIWPVGQFLWSLHVELVALFVRG